MTEVTEQYKFIKIDEPLQREESILKTREILIEDKTPIPN